MTFRDLIFFFFFYIYTNKKTMSVSLAANRLFYALLSYSADDIRCWNNYQRFAMGSLYWNRSMESFKKCKKHVIFSPFWLRNHTVGSCAYMRTTTKTTCLATIQYHVLWITIRDAQRQNSPIILTSLQQDFCRNSLNFDKMVDLHFLKICDTWA